MPPLSETRNALGEIKSESGTFWGESIIVCDKGSLSRGKTWRHNASL